MIAQRIGPPTATRYVSDPFTIEILMLNDLKNFTERMLTTKSNH